MLGIDRAKMRAWPQCRLDAECRKLSDEWERKGRPNTLEMPQIMLARYVALQAERERRGEQLRLWELID